jgi:acyl carrier protein
MDKTQFYALVAEILEIDPQAISGGDMLQEIGNWDSLAVISFVAAVDREFGTIIEADRLQAARTVDDLAALVGL